MKKLQKIKLINWYLFDNETINIKDDVVVSGENGSGKSTLLDAIGYVLSVGDWKFNKAASDMNSERSIYTYIKARTGNESHPYVREEANIISHIALEFYDEGTRKSTVIGVVMEIINDSLKPDKQFYYYSGQINDEFFFNQKDGTLKNSDDFTKCLKNQNNLKLNIFGADGNHSRSQFSAKALEINANNYPKFLKKAIAFNALDDISSFAKDFLFESSNIDANQLEEAALAYRSIKSQLEKNTAECKLLFPIVNIRNEIIENKKDSLLAKLLLDDETQNSIKKKIGDGNSKLVQINNDIDNRTSLISYKEKEINKKRKDYYGINSNSDLTDYKNLKSRLDDASNNKKAILSKISSYSNIIKFEEEILQKLEIKSNLASLFNEKSFSSFQFQTIQNRKEIEEKNNQLVTEQAKINSELPALNLNLNKVSQEIESLEKGINYLPEIDKIIESIQEENIKEGNQETSITPLCDLLEINNESWRGALEAILGKRRFDLFVPDISQNSAKKIFEKTNKDIDFIGSGFLCNIENKDSSGEYRTDSIASLINVPSNNEDIRKYIDFLIGDIRMGDISSTNYSDGPFLTSDGLYFDGKSTRRFSNEEMEDYYIGDEGKKKRLEKLSDEFKELQSKIKNLQDKLSENKQLIIFINSSRINELINVEPVFSDLSNCQQNINECTEKIKILKSKSNDLDKQFQLLAEIKKEIDNMVEEEKKLQAEGGNLNVEKGKTENQLTQDTKSLKDITDEILNFKRTNKEIIGENPDLNNLKNKAQNANLIDFAKQQLKSLEKGKDSILIRLKINLANYNKEFGNSFEIISQDNLEDAEKRYDLLRFKDNGNLSARADDAYKRMVELFRSCFSSQISNKISEAKSTTRHINEVLRNHPFGTNKEVYQFQVRPTQNGVYAAAGKIFDEMERNVLGYNSLTSEEKNVLNDIFSLLANPKTDAKRIDDYKDYRNYLDYDILTTNSKGQQSYYSKNMKSRSGGENQNPFYAMVAAALSQDTDYLINSGKNPCCVLLMDEAFNNMDEERIDEMLNYYHDLHIQVIFSVPTNRVDIFLEKVKTNIILTNIDDQTIVSTNYKEDEEQVLNYDN
jgi:uncharacterized protein YPO0396